VNVGFGGSAGIDASGIADPIATILQDLTDIVGGLDDMQTGISGGVNVGILGQQAGSDLGTIY
jgi:hypothetical protein